MNKLKKLLVITLFFLLISLVNFKVLASETLNSGQFVPYSEAYQKWLQLSDEEKQKILPPRMYDIQYSKITSKNPLLRSRMLGASINSKYTLQDIIPNNLAIRDQQDTDSCWAFATMSSLETNLALTNYKNGTNTSKVYDYSERHMDYATSYFFKDNKINARGYNRKGGTPGNWAIGISYLTNGSGAINESEMPFENNGNTIAIDLIQNKTVATQVYDTIEFPDYNSNLLSESESYDIINQIKNHIQNYGALYGQIKAGGYTLATASIARNGAVGVDREDLADHCISIIGWNDNYSKSNWDVFEEKYRPTSNGAWIARNSWGTEAGDNGLLYISYEDESLSSSFTGILKATDTIQYENIYQYDYYYPNAYEALEQKATLCNIFDKKTSGTEYLTQVSLYVPGNYTCRVFVNPNGTGKTKSDLKLVSLKAGESETVNTGYHTFEFEKPIQITSDKFAVAIEMSSTNNSTVYASYVRNDSDTYSPVEVQTGKCFRLSDSDSNWTTWIDLGSDDRYHVNSTIKAFTTSELTDGSLKNIEIKTPPAKTDYWVGENFDSSGMEVYANYNSKTNPSVKLDSSSYSITNGTNLKVGQNSVTITYEGISIEQPIRVKENKLESISITTKPTKTEYWAGEDFNSSGMVVVATYTNGTKSPITDYTITNGLNLKNKQSSITVSYNGKTTEQKITVKENSVVKIEITHAPNKTNYVVGQNFNSTGMIVKATYANGTVKTITDYNISDGNNLSKDKKTVTILYEGQSVTQDITVVEKAVTKISVKTIPAKRKYIQNKEELDLTGGIIEVTYNDSSTESIKMNSDQISATGFNNKKPGKVSIVLTYLSKTTQYEVEIIEETIIEEKAENSKLDNAVVNIKSVNTYYFTNKSKKYYTLIDVDINGIVKNTNNDKMEYSYFLSSNPNEENITGWVKIEESQVKNNSINFTIDTSKISNYDEISNSEVVYLYLKEVATKGGNQSVGISNSMKLASDVEINTYIDNIKIEIDNSIKPSDIKDSSSIPSANDTSKDPTDKTVANGILPNTGSKAIVIVFSIILLSVLGIIFYKKSNWLKDIK